MRGPASPQVKIKRVNFLRSYRPARTWTVRAMLKVERTPVSYGVVAVEEPFSVSFNSSNGLSSSEIRPCRGVSICVISVMTIATRSGKTNRKNRAIR